MTPFQPIPKDSHRPICPAWEKLYNVCRPVHKQNWSCSATIKEGCSNMQCVKELVLHIWCTEEISSDGERQFDSFLEDWGIKKRILSTHYPQNHGQVKLAIKTAKRTLMDCIDGYSHLCHDQTAQAMMTHRNTPPSGPWLVTSRNVVKDIYWTRSRKTFTTAHSKSFRFVNWYRCKMRRDHINGGGRK